MLLRTKKSDRFVDLTVLFPHHITPCIGFENWDTENGQPDFGFSSDPEKCIFLGHKRTFGLKWHDHKCRYDINYICEYSRVEESMPGSETSPEPSPSSSPSPSPLPESEPTPKPLCEEGWVAGPNDACYTLPENVRANRMTYEAALIDCQLMAIFQPTVSLVSIKSEEEQKFVEMLLTPYPGNVLMYILIC